MPSSRSLQLYGLRNCDGCRKAVRWLDANGVEYAFVDIRETPPSKKQLEAWLATGQGVALVNRRSTTWRQLSEAERARADTETAALLAAHPTLIKRPVITDGASVVSVGFDPDRIEDWLGGAS